MVRLGHTCPEIRAESTALVEKEQSFIYITYFSFQFWVLSKLQLAPERDYKLE